MKQFLIVTFSIFLSVSTLAQAENDSLTAANTAYKKGNFAKAISMYQGILKQGFESEALYYNLGNAYYKNGEVAKSILNYERALLLDPDDEDALQNLEIAGLSTVDRFEVMPQPLIRSAYQSIFKSFSPSNWSYTAFVFLLVSLIFTALYFFSDSKKLGFTMAIIGFVLFGFTLSMAFQHKSYLQKNKAAIVMKASSYAKSGPSKQAEDVFILHEGTKVTVIEAFEKWEKVRLPDGKIGWLPKADLGMVVVRSF